MYWYQASNALDELSVERLEELRDVFSKTQLYISEVYPFFYEPLLSEEGRRIFPLLSRDEQRKLIIDRLEIEIVKRVETYMRESNVSKE